MPQERGFALLMVLWTLVLLAFLAAVFGSNARTEVYLARNLVENARAEALADGGVFRAAAGLAKPPSEGGYRGDGQVYIWQQAGGEVRFAIRDEGGKVDLNQADEVLLRELLAAVGVDPVPSAEIADAIGDFRDEDEDKRPRGGEGRDYAAAGLPWQPKNAPFVLVDELIYVLGVTPEIYRKAAPLLTVYSQQETPHEYTAPPEVLSATTAAVKAARGRRPTAAGEGTGTRSATGSSGSGGFGRESVGRESTAGSASRQGSEIGAGRSSAFGSSRSDTGSDRSGLTGDAAREEQEQERRDRSGGTVFSVHAEGRTADGTVFARDAVLDVAGSETAPVVFRTWRQGERSLFPANAAAGGG